MYTPTLRNTGASVALELVRGAAFARTITYKVNGAVQNITGYTFTSQIRTTGSVNVVSLTCTVTDAANGVFTIALTANETASLTAGTPYVWSLEQSVSGVASELLRGPVTVFEEVTA